MTEKQNLNISGDIKVLVVDDEKRIRDVCQTMLAQDGFQVSVAENGDIGLKMIDREPYDIILLDLMMPGISGLEVLDHVRGNYPDTVVIVITGYATLEHAVGAMKKGAFDFIPKPFGPDELRLVIKKAIDYLRTLQDIVTEKSRMRTLINHLADGVMATDAEKHVALANPAFLKMIGYRGRNVIGLPLEEMVKNETLREMIEDTLSMPDKDFDGLSKEFGNGSLSEKEDMVLGVRCIPFRDRLNRNLGTVTVINDLTALKKMDQQKSDFVSMVAHEIKGPMNTAMMQIKVILDQLAGPVTEKQREILNRVTEKIKGLAELSAELLDLAKIESGLINQEKKRVNLSTVIEEQVAFHRARARTKGIEMILRALPDSAFILGNRVNIEEVISNLINNAIKYTPEDGEVEVSALTEEGNFCVSIRDNGIGIPEKDLDQIFGRFYRVRNKKTRFISGTGLGLAIVKSIVEAHSGMITVESKLDEGSTFKVCLPVIC